MNKICAVYKITNTITGDFYIGSSKDVKHRWAVHKCQSTWNKHPNNQMYIDMKEHGVDKFVFEILAEVEIEQLKKIEQEFIETLKPIYNSNRAKGFDFERYKETQKEYRNVHKECNKEYQKEYRQSEKFKKCQKKYQNQLCLFNGETLTLNALRMRFKIQGIDHPTAEAKKYLIEHQ